jgi:hypothetical protein
MDSAPPRELYEPITRGRSLAGVKARTVSGTMRLFSPAQMKLVTSKRGVAKNNKKAPAFRRDRRHFRGRVPVDRRSESSFQLHLIKSVREGAGTLTCGGD